MIGIAGGALVAAAALVAPAFGAIDRPSHQAVKPAPRAVGGFTPASGDPRLAALLARGGFEGSAFRFTPAESRRDSRAVTVAVRARTTRGVANRTAVASDATTGIAPIAYNLGVAVGWKRFAIASDVSRVDMAAQPGSRESADVALSYTAPRWSGRVKAEADRPTGTTPRLVTDLPGYSVDLGGSYSLTRNLDVTAGVRYRADRDRLTQIDQRRDSQAVYVGTAFRF
ncbi:hypothetical protein Q5H91_11310 [Sphingomonas sp. KR1UV-12]|uniref:Porin domain-containing protein n=1 Tax=Sphingomonas aurea TaxID=3063994 RepID=A0ABT9ELG6_9SPHN|nr:hypothetical protein [Sphingomonas sp. KR1UV-12]MDP1027804.1 hypothetical protein [Sphingomonas sp. KR1UV-12]